jgi:hypothetical protein
LGRHGFALENTGMTGSIPRRFAAAFAGALLFAIAPFSAHSQDGRPSPRIEPLEPLARFLPDESPERLATEPKRRSAFGKEASLPLLMPSSFVRDEVLSHISEIRPNLLVEALYLLKRTPPEDPNREILGISKIFRSISSLAGIEYWSASRKRMWPFYTESYVVDSPKTANRIPDPVLESLPARDRAFAFQRDTTFGGNLYAYDFLSDGKSFALIGRNLGALRYMLLPIMNENDLGTLVFALPLREGILVYGLSAAKAFLLPGMEARTLASLSNRADALYAWFARAMDTEYR